MTGKSRAADRQTNGSNRGRRRFIEGIAAAGAVAAFGLPTLGESLGTEPAVLTGDHFNLVIDLLPVNFTGRRVMATAVNGSTPGPILRWMEGDTVTIPVPNRLPPPASISCPRLRFPPTC